MVGGSSISGDVGMVNAGGLINAQGGPTVAGAFVPDTSSQATDTTNTAWKDHVHVGVVSPTFPVVDTSGFVQYATNVMKAGDKTNLKNYSNLYIKANTNPNFTGGPTIKGVIYIETPNTVSFAGGTVIQGVIVEATNGSGSPAANTLTFAGNVTAQPVSTLDATYGGADGKSGLKAMGGAFILAPDFGVSMKGDFGTISGSMVVGSLDMTGNAKGTVNGTAIVMNGNANLGGNSDLIINSQGVNQFPAGVTFGQHFTPLPALYDEPLQ